MDDDAEFLNIFNVAGSLADFTQNGRPERAPVRLDGAGAICELKEFDSVYNAEGKRVQVKSGSVVLLRDRSLSSFKSALVRTRFWSRDGKEEKCDLDIRSSHMKAALKSIVTKYKSTNFDTKHITLPNAGRDLFHYLPELFAYGLTLVQDSDNQAHVSYLIQYFDREFSQAIWVYTSSVDLVIGPPSLDFAHLWMVFKPGEPVYVPVSIPKVQSPFAFEFVSMTLSCQCQTWACVRNHVWWLEGYVVDTIGEHVSYRSASRVRLPYYDGARDLTDLPAVPLCLRRDQEEIRSELLSRGRKFIALQGCHHRQYRGTALTFAETRNTPLFGVEDDYPPLQTLVRSVA